MFVGVDISKATFDVAILNDGHYHTDKFAKNSLGLSLFVKWACAFDQPLIFCFEAMGISGLPLAKYLYFHRHKVMWLIQLKPMPLLKWKWLAIKQTRLMHKLLLVIVSIYMIKMQ